MFVGRLLTAVLFLLGIVTAEAEVCGPVDCHRGRKGKAGKEGPYGQPGFNGDQGEAGLIGGIGGTATGPNLSLFLVGQWFSQPGSYLYFPSFNQYTFDFQVQSPDFETAVTFYTPGAYMVSFVFFGYVVEGTASIQLELNNNTVPFSSYTNQSGQQIIGQALVNVFNPGSVLKVKNVSDGELVADRNSVVTASLDIVRYGEPIETIFN